MWMARTLPPRSTTTPRGSGSGTLEGYVAVRDDTVITVSNTGTADDGSYLQIYVSYYFNEDGTYTRYDSPTGTI